MIALIDHQQLLDAPFVKNPPRNFLAGAKADGRQIIVSHELADRLAGVSGEAHVAIGQDAAELARSIHDRDAADAVGLHQLERLGQRLIRGHADRVDDHAAFETLDLANSGRLLFDAEVAVEHADPAELSKRDCHIGFGHGVHRRREDWNLERDLAGEEGSRVRLAREHA